MKPGDEWTISLCRWHHARQHQIGEGSFESAYGIDMIALAYEFARLSPALQRYRAKQKKDAAR